MSNKEIAGVAVILLVLVLVMNAPQFEFPNNRLYAFIAPYDSKTSVWQGYHITYTLQQIQQVDANRCSWSSTYSDSQNLVIGASRSAGSRCAGVDITNTLSIEIPLGKNDTKLQSVYINSVGTASKSRLGFASISSSIGGKQIAYTSSGTKEGEASSSFSPILLILNGKNISLPTGESLIYQNNDNLIVSFAVLASNQQYNAEGGSAYLEIKEIRTVYSPPLVVVTPTPVVNTTTPTNQSQQMCTMEVGVLCKLGHSICTEEVGSSTCSPTIDRRTYTNGCQKTLLKTQGYGDCEAYSPPTLFDEITSLFEYTNAAGEEEKVIVLPSKENSGTIFGISIGILVIVGLVIYFIANRR